MYPKSLKKLTQKFLKRIKKVLIIWRKPGKNLGKNYEITHY